MKIDASEISRKPYLDGLRGVAACIVFFAHLMIAVFPAVVTFSPTESHYWGERAIGLSPLGWLWNGSFAVCIFFVLSGYVLAGFCQMTKIGVPAQVLRRYLRLALPMLMTSALAYVIMSLGLYKNLDAAVQVTKSGWLSMWYRAFEPSLFGMAKEALYDAFQNGRANYNSNLWTMRIELIASVTIFLAYGTLRNVIVRVAACATFISLTYDWYYCLFAVGVVFYELESSIGQMLDRLNADRDSRENVLLGLFFFGVYLGSYPHIQPDMSATWHFFLPKRVPAVGYHMIGAIITVGALLFSSTAQRWLGSRFGRYLGRLSFVLYLVHLPIICSVTAWTMYSLGALPYSVNSLIGVTVTIAVVFGVSTLLYLYVDVYTTSFSRYAGKTFDAWFPARFSRICETPPPAPPISAIKETAVV
jgi:peptidoglycan/LPS O-acetylase OafA/YrhL